MKFVFDTSSLIILHQSTLFPLISEILNRMDSKMVLLKAIEDEILSVPTDRIIKSFDPERVDFIPSKEFIPELGFGERAVIEYVLNQENGPDYVCVLDDLKARKIAKQIDTNVVGLLGITGRGFEICTIKTKTKLQEIWDNWKTMGFRIPKSKLLEVYMNSIKKIEQN